MKKCFYAICLSSLLFVSNVFGVTLAWDAPTNYVDGISLPTAEISGYKLYYGFSSGNYVTNIDTATNLTELTLPNSMFSGTVYFAISVYNTYTNESDLSSQIVWRAFAPNAPTVSSYSYATKTGLMKISGSAPTKNSDGSSCSGQIAGYIVGYGKVSRGVMAYTNMVTSLTVAQNITFAVNSGTWYLSMCASNIYGAVGPWGQELSFGTSNPSKPNLKVPAAFDLR